jgi:hypothetical protein
MDSIQHPGIFMSDYKVYAELAWMLRDRLTELFICGESFFSSSKQPVDAIIRTNNDQLVESLASFRKLESVDIELDGKHIYEFDKYIDACPPSSLEIVKITSYVSPQVLLNDSDFQKRAMPQRNDLSKIKQWPQVKQLSVTIPIANDDSLLYLMQKFPSLLEFELNANTENQLGYVNRQFAANLSRQTLDSFYLYLSSISNCFIEKFYGKLVLQSSAAIK